MESSKILDNGYSENGDDNFDVEIKEISESNETQEGETESTTLLSTSVPSGDDTGGIVVQGSGGSIFQVTPAIVVHEVEPTSQNGKALKVNFVDDEDGKNIST